MEIEIVDRIGSVSADQWNRLNPDNNPFLRHEFLQALEQNDCASARYGWHPRHLLLWSASDQQPRELLAASPMYLKENSYGEFVFDHAWADAYQRNGLNYYPKLVSAVPYTPAFGRRVLIRPALEDQRGEIMAGFAQAAEALAKSEGCSSIHWLFITEQERDHFHTLSLPERTGVQFHWHNQAYRSFDDFLARLNSKRRKNIRRERRSVSDQNLRIRVICGSDVTAEEWALFTRFYNKTFEERYSMPTLNLGFFTQIGETMGNQVVLVLAYDQSECVAGALMFRSDHTLYGRHWGCEREYDSLHFEVCYYQGIEYCIAHSLQHFEPGAQGEHKIWRGFLPRFTFSSHRIMHPGFANAIEEFLAREKPAIIDYKKQLDQSSPFK